MITNTVFSAVTLLTSAALLSSCAIAPAALQTVSLGNIKSKYDDETFGDLLIEALKDQGTEDGKLALGAFVECWAEARDYANEGTVTVRDNGTPREYHIRFVGDGPAEYGLEYFSEIRSAADFKVKRIDRYRRDGIGAPLLAMRENEGEFPIEKFYPPEGISRSVTAVITKDKRRSDGSRELEISLLCCLRNETVTIDGEESPLAADFSISWAGLLERLGELKTIGFLDAIVPEPKREPQLYLMEAYDPAKEPVIMIHGLFSSPVIWADVSNRLWAEPEFRERYQIWHYLYNTSAPALYSGRILRGQLRDLRLLLDPGLDDPAMQSTTVVAHSMGGLVTRSLITRPGEVFWDAAFKKPLAKLELDPKDRESLKNAFYWEPETHVKRVVYIAVPHRGSDFADGPLGKLGRRLVDPPVDFTAFYQRISRQNPGVFTEGYAELGEGKLDSVHSLSPHQPTLKIMMELPNSHAVEVHSIIGDRGRKKPISEGSDGIVEYWSSHLDDADSETIVPFNHSKAVGHRDAIVKLKDILIGNSPVATQ